MDVAILGLTGAVAIAVAVITGALLLGAIVGFVLAGVKLLVWLYYGFVRQPEVQQAGEYRLEQGHDAAARPPAGDDRSTGQR